MFSGVFECHHLPTICNQCKFAQQFIQKKQGYVAMKTTHSLFYNQMQVFTSIFFVFCFLNNTDEQHIILRQWNKGFSFYAF
jgi:hypothetical protein